MLSSMLWPGKRTSFAVKINFLLGLGLAILLAVGTVAYRSIDVLVESGRFESDTQAEQVKLELTVSAMRRAESLLHQYMITGDARDLAGFRAARAQCEAAVNELRTSGDTDQRRRFAALKLAMTELLALLDRSAQARADKGLQAAAALAYGAGALRLDQDIESLTDELRLYAGRSFRLRREETAFSAGTTTFMISWGTAFAVALLLWAMVVIHRHQTGRQAAERALQASEAQLRLITDAVPAFIGYVDHSGRLLFHNRTIESWLNRGAAEIDGRTLRELIGPEAYRAMESGVQEVLAGREARAEFTLDADGGRKIDVSAHLVPRREASGPASGYYVLATDISALKEVGRLKNEFVATVSHELRTPLTSIRGSLGMLAGGVTGALPDKARQLVTIAMENSERLVRLVNDILDSEKLRDDKVEMNIRDMDLGPLVERSIRENEGYAGTYGVRLAYAADANVPKIAGDGDRLLQVVTNLISNACKFSPQGGEVEVSLHSADGRVELSVSDRGPGIPEDLRGRLFERFAQLDASDARRRGGTGLGLSICRSIIQRLGGDIGYRPREGGGSTFYFSLPAAAQTGEAG